MTTIKQPVWTHEITPSKGGLDLRLNEVWRYRDLVYLFVRRDLVAQYKQTILGPAWHLVQPLLTTLMFTVVFGRIAKLSTDGLPPFLFYMAGTVVWAYFSTVLTKTSDTFIANAGIFGKVYFPRLVVPVSVLISQLVAFATQFAFFLGFLFFFSVSGAPVEPNIWVLLTPILLLMMAALGMGVGIIISSLTTRYRDLKVLVAFGVQLAMYATPVVYPMSVVEGRFGWLLYVNPVAPILEAFRFAFLGQGVLDFQWLALSAATTITLLVGGVITFNRVERTFMDTV